MIAEDLEGTRVAAGLVKELLIKTREQHKRIVIIGDVMVDRWIHGHLAECQDDCPKFVQECVLESPGGAANAERSLLHWGVNTSLYGWAHNDCPTKTRYLVDGKIVFRADDDNSLGAAESRRQTYHWSYDLALEMVARAGAVLLSDYDKGFLTPEFIRAVADLCRRRGIPCVADAKRGPEVYEGCIIKANGAWGVRQLDAGWVKIDRPYVETHGARYPGVWDSGGLVITKIPTYPCVECVNHVGAGDCFASHLALALAYGFSLKEAAAIAYSAGRVYVTKPHNYPPTVADIAADMASAT